MDTISRFRLALHPTDTLHVTTLHATLFSWAAARSLDGDLILRINDLDGGQNSAEKQLIENLRWLGLDWDEGPYLGGESGPYRQSQRTAQYKTAAQQLTASGALSQQLATVIDDHQMAITHVVYSNHQRERVQAELAIYNALSWQPPTYISLPPIVDDQQRPVGQRSRAGGYLLRHFHQAGFLPKALWVYLLLLGWTPSVEPTSLTKWTIRKQFQLDAVSSDPQRFDWNALRVLNQHFVRKLNTGDLAARLRDFLEDAYGALPSSDQWLLDLTDAIRDELIVLDDAVDSAEWAFDQPSPTAEAQQMLRLDVVRPIFAHLLADIASVVLLDESTANSIIRSVYERTAVAQTIAMPQFEQLMRSALMGRPDGPNVGKLFGILGKQRSLERIGAALAR